jgi:hypothetical protein
VSRFYDDGDWDYGRYMLWEHAQGRALSSPRGQQALETMEAALLALPTKRLIDSALSKDGEVCAVGAFALYKRTAAGEQRDAVLADLERKSEPDDTYCAADVTASVGHNAGMAYSVAWRMAELNDEDFLYATPEQRYAGVLAWVRKAQGKTLVAA